MENETKPFNVYALLGLIFSVLGFYFMGPFAFLFGFLFSVIGLSTSKQRGGAFMGIVGFMISLIPCLILVPLFILGVITVIQLVVFFFVIVVPVPFVAGLFIFGCICYIIFVMLFA